MTKITFTVDGWPPAKSEALSIFSTKHPHRDRVSVLLSEARRELDKSDWNPDERRQIGFELSVSETATMSPPSDATNYLGGVADVLQAKRSLDINLSDLGELAWTSLYSNDKQIREIRYSVIRGDKPAYSVRIWVLAE